MPRHHQVLMSLHCLFTSTMFLSSHISNLGWTGVSAVNGTGSSQSRELPLSELNSFWSYNESDLSKYEDFDHSRFLEELPGVQIEEPSSGLTTRPPWLPLKPPSQRTPPPMLTSFDLPVFDNSLITNVSEELPGVQIEEPSSGLTTRPPWLPLKPPSQRTPPPMLTSFDLPVFDNSLITNVSEELPGVQIEEPSSGSTTRPPWLPLKPPSQRTPPPMLTSFDLPVFDNSLITNVSEELPGVQIEEPSSGSTTRPPWLPLKPPSQRTPPPMLTSFDLPVFDNSLITNVSTQLGDTAFLNCRVKNTEEHSEVTWIRRRDWHILSSGVVTFTNDERFQVLHSENSDNWDLQIKFVQKRDNGTYECQVATGKGTISHYYNLNVVVPAAYIIGNGEYHIGEGSTISLVCIIENSPTPPQYVFWYHNERMINYDTVRGGVSVSTEPGVKTHSRLTVTKATPGDSGNYTCRAPNTEEETIYVFVSKEGDNTAAIQRQASSGQRWPLACFLLLTSVVLGIC